MIPYGKQHISQQDVDSVVAILQSDWLTQGPAIERFENSVAKHVNARYGVAVNSATSALHIGCLALGLGPGDWLWTSPNTFVASANAGIYCGAKVDFVDIDPKTYNLSVEDLSRKLEIAKLNKVLPKVVVPVHFAGQSCQMAEIYELSKKYGFSVMEDASHAIGGTYKSELVGNCLYSDLTIFSFHPVKIITTAEGGLVTTNRPELYDKLLRLRSHGITRDTKLMSESSHGPWYYQQLELGLNYRMTDIQAGLGLSQIDRLEEFVNRRRELAARYDKLLCNLPVVIPWQYSDSVSSWHLYVVLLDQNKTQKSRREVFEFLRNSGIGVNVHYIPVHTQPFYQSMGFGWGDFQKSEEYYWQAISLPLFSGLSDAAQDKVVASLRMSLS